jgi:IS1 family transposase
VLVDRLDPQDVNVVIQKVHEAEMDERWSVVGDTEPQRWLWPAMDHHRGAILAYIGGTPTDTVVFTLTKLLMPCGMSRFSTDDGGTDHRQLNPRPQAIGQE